MIQIREAAVSATVPPYIELRCAGAFEEFLRKIKTAGVGEQLIMKQNYFLEQFMRHGSPTSRIVPSEATACQSPVDCSSQ